MKNANKFLGLIAMAIIAIAVIGCKHDDPTPTPIERDISLGTIKGYNVTLHCMALPGVNPSYMTPLAGALDMLIGSGTGNRTVNVISGNDAPSFVSGRLTIGESRLVGKDKDAIAVEMASLNFANWTAMMKSTKDTASARTRRVPDTKKEFA
jgi:hypothetical protein